MRLLILYGSQTGTAQDVAESIWRASKKFNYTGPVLPCDSYRIDDLIKEKIVIFVCATTGQGDEPDNMKLFWKFLLRRNLPSNSLSGVKFAVIGLGDSSYDKYNFVAKKLYKRLKQLSAQPLLHIGLCDDQHDYGIYATCFKWMDQLWKELGVTSYKMKDEIDIPKYQFKMKVTKSAADDDNQQQSEIDLYNYKWPIDSPKCCTFKIVENNRVTDAQHFQDVRHIKLAFPVHVRWHPFDVVNVRPWNSDSNVNKLFQILAEQSLDIDAEYMVDFETCEPEMPLSKCYKSPAKIGLIAKYVWDLTSIPRQRAFELLALNCTDDTEKEKLLELASPEGLDDLIKYANRPRRTVLEVLHDFPNAVSKLTLPVLFELFDIIKARAFSIASIPEIGTLDMLVAVVEYKTIMSEPRRGLCSNWLKHLSRNDEICGSVSQGTMLITTGTRHPVVMIGPGTGIAPFRSYLLRTEYDFENGITREIQKIIVIFGCRSRYKDFYFRDDFKRMQRKRIATFYYAFSRDQEHKRYVQHIILEKENLLSVEILLRNGTVLVAGSSNNMPKQVREAFTTILGNPRYLEEIMIKKKRYQEEVWS